VVMRDPATPGWPARGPRTTDEATAKAWRKRYEDHLQRSQDEQHQHSTGQYPTLRKAVDAWLRHRTAQNEDSTASASRTALTHVMEAVGEEIHPAAVTSRQLQSLWDDFLAEGYKASSVASIRHLVSAFFRWLDVTPNPISGTVVRKDPKRDVQAWDPDQRQRIRVAADEIDRDPGHQGPSRRRLVEFLFAVGPRIQEAAAARWEWIDRRAKTARIVEQISRRDNQAKGLKERRSRTAVVLQEWWEFHQDGAVGLLFPGAGGDPIPYRTLYGYVAEVLIRAGLKRPGQAAHQFRHTYAFLFLERGGSMEQLQKSLGHAKITTTQEYYDHYTSEHAARSGVHVIYRTKSSVRRGPRKR
jgi:integrase